MSTAERKPFAGRGCFKPLGSFWPDSLQNRIRQFFLANPDEELTYRDMATKFDCTTEQAKGAVADYLKGDKSKIPADGVMIIPGLTLTKDNVKQFQEDFQKKLAGG